jgi:hypothetical protein
MATGFDKKVKTSETVVLPASTPKVYPEIARPDVFFESVKEQSTNFKSTVVNTDSLNDFKCFILYILYIEYGIFENI